MIEPIASRPRPPAVRLLDADPDFARAVPPADRALADRALTLPARRIDAGEVIEAGPDPLLLVEGAAWREVRVGAACGPQLLGPGAVLLPAPPGSDLLVLTSRVTALDRSRAVALDRRFVLASSRWHGLPAILHARIAQQERDLGTLAAIGQHPRVDDRLLALLWHLAERWGTVTGAGVRVPLRLTHAALGRFVAARRPTVTLALAELRDAGLLEREADGSWTLLGSPPAASAPPAPDARIEPLPDLLPRGAGERVAGLGAA